MNRRSIVIDADDIPQPVEIAVAPAQLPAVSPNTPNPLDIFQTKKMVMHLARQLGVSLPPELSEGPDRNPITGAPVGQREGNIPTVTQRIRSLLADIRGTADEEEARQAVIASQAEVERQRRIRDREGERVSRAIRDGAAAYRNGEPVSLWADLHTNNPCGQIYLDNRSLPSTQPSTEGVPSMGRGISSEELIRLMSDLRNQL